MEVQTTLENKLFYLSQFNETPETNEENFIREAVLFSTGKHRGQEYTEQDLDRLVANFNADEMVPLQYDHSESARDTVGYLKEVYREGKDLLGTVEVIDPTAQQRISKRLNTKLSIGFYVKNKLPNKIREVSLVAFPQVKSARLFSEGNYVSDFEEEELNNMGNEKQTFAELQTQMAEMQKQHEAQFAEQQKLIEELSVKANAFDELEVSTKVASFAETGKIVPAQKDALEKLLASFSEEQAEAFQEFMESQAKVEFTEQGQVDNEDGEENEKDEFEEFYAEQTKRFGSKL